MDNQIVRPMAGYYLVLSAFLAAAFFPELRVWGLNWWAYLPTWVPYGLFSLGAAAPPLLWYVLRRRKFIMEKQAEKPGSDGAFLAIAACITVLSGILFYWLRAKTHFLGDGYTLLSSLSSGHAASLKAREIGESLIHLWLRNLIGGDGNRAALLSYQIISISVGIVFVIVAALLARSLFRRTVDRTLFLLGLCSGGYMLLYFGYVENYSLLVLSVLLFSLAGLSVIRKGTPRWVIVPPLALAVFFHVLGFTLVPGAIYVLLAGTRVGNRIWRTRHRTKWLIGFLVACGASAAFYHYYTTHYFFRFALIPIVEGRFTVEGYTLFSWKHLVDYFNLLMLLLPGVPVLAMLLLTRPRGKVSGQRQYTFLLTLLLSVLGAVFIFDPKLGMPRDWDLFSFAGVPLAVIAYAAVLDSVSPNIS